MSIFNKDHQDRSNGGPDTVTLETGEIARQSGGAVVVSVEDTVILATVVARKDAKPRPGLLPADRRLRREDVRGRQDPAQLLQARRPPERVETLTSWLIDWPLRPLFPEGFYNEVQVIIHVLSPEPGRSLPTFRR